MNMKKTNKLFMAFGVGTETTEGFVSKRYIGIAPVFVLGVNPNKSELEKIYDRELEKDPEYLGEREVGEAKTKVPQVRLDFIVKTDEAKCGVDMTTKVALYLAKEYRYDKLKTKVQVIDKYGRTAWVTIEQAKAKEIPMYSNGPANIDKDYRPAYIGEAELTEFLKIYLSIPNVMKYNRITNVWSLVDNPSDCESRLDNISKYFDGDFSELKSIIALQPKNKLKCMFGVRTTDDNKQYQAVYTQMFLRNAVTNYDKIALDLKERKDAGYLLTTEYATCDLREDVVMSTDFNTVASQSVNPVAPSTNIWAQKTETPVDNTDDLPF